MVGNYAARMARPSRPSGPKVTNAGAVSRRADQIAAAAGQPHCEAARQRIRRCFADEYRKLGA